MKLLVAFLLTFFVYTYAQEDVIRAAMKKQLEAPQLRTTISYDDPMLGSATIDYVAPDRFRLKDATSDIIVIGDTTYQNEGSGWEVLGQNMAAIINQYRNGDMIDSIILSDVQMLSDETLDGKGCEVYSYTQDFKGLVSVDKLWIEKSTGLPVRLESQGDFLGMTSLSVIHYDYDTELSIEIPAN
jgi:hypothetical protein